MSEWLIWICIFIVSKDMATDSDNDCVIKIVTDFIRQPTTAEDQMKRPSFAYTPGLFYGMLRFHQSYCFHALPPRQCEYRHCNSKPPVSNALS